LIKQLSARRTQSAKPTHTKFFTKEEFQQHQWQALKTVKTSHMKTTKTATKNYNKEMPHLSITN
jgi:hypothetical protein